MKKKRIAFFDAKPYDKNYFDQLNDRYEFVYFESKLHADTARLAQGFDGVCAFVNDEIDRHTIKALAEQGIHLIAMRCAGYNNVDVKAAYEHKIHIVRVPAYSPHAVAEHAMALLLTLNRKIHKAYIRTRDFNFSLVGLTGIDLYGKTVGVIGTGAIGRTFIEICRGFGLKVLAYDPYPNPNLDVEYVDLDRLFHDSDILSLHCPLSEQTYHLLNHEAFSKMKRGIYILNTSRGALIDTHALLEALNEGIVRGAGLDVYEEEADFFFEDMSFSIVKDDTLSLLVSRPNVILTSHQAFLTEEALIEIAQTTLANLDAYFANEVLKNEICYHCDASLVKNHCRKTRNRNCF